MEQHKDRQERKLERITTLHFVTGLQLRCVRVEVKTELWIDLDREMKQQKCALETHRSFTKHNAAQCVWYMLCKQQHRPSKPRIFNQKDEDVLHD